MAGWRVLALVLLTVLCLTAGCSSRSPLVNPAQTLPPRVPDSSLAMGDLQEWRDFHYGHWEYDPGIGWAWVPGYAWAPAEVVWYTGYEDPWGAPLPPPEVVLPRPGEGSGAVQGGRGGGGTAVQGAFDRLNFRGIVSRVRERRWVATTREILRANLSLDLPLSLFSSAQLPPPGPPPVPHFLFFDR